LCGVDGRCLIGIAEALFELAPGTPITVEDVSAVAQARSASHDRTDDFHYWLLSALQKSILASDETATSYDIARLVKDGEPARNAFRRLPVMATEEIGWADAKPSSMHRPVQTPMSGPGDPEGPLPYSTVRSTWRRVPRAM
jgi:putative ATPase